MKESLYMELAVLQSEVYLTARQKNLKTFVALWALIINSMGAVGRTWVD
jgi:hypothetical protein